MTELREPSDPPLPADPDATDKEYEVPEPKNDPVPDEGAETDVLGARP